MCLWHTHQYKPKKRHGLVRAVGNDGSKPTDRAWKHEVWKHEVCQMSCVSCCSKTKSAACCQHTSPLRFWMIMQPTYIRSYSLARQALGTHCVKLCVHFCSPTIETRFCIKERALQPTVLACYHCTDCCCTSVKTRHAGCSDIICACTSMFCWIGANIRRYKIRDRHRTHTSFPISRRISFHAASKTTFTLGCPQSSALIRSTLNKAHFWGLPVHHST